MKYIKLFEKFTKEYQNKIDLKDFKKIKKGSMIQYMGGAVEVVDNNGYVLKLKDDDGKIFTVNKSQFDHGGRISEVSDGKKKKKKKEFHPDMMYELKRTLVSGTMSGSTESLEDRKYELKKDAKGATIGSFSNVTLPKGTIIYNLPGGVFADHFSLKNKYASRSSQGPQYFDKPTFKGIMIKQTPAVLSYIEKNSKVLESIELEEAAKPYKKGQRIDYQLDHKGGVGKFADATSKSKNIESGVIKKRTKGLGGTFKYELTNGLELYGSEIVGLTESSSKDGGDKSNGNSHHDDHQEKSIAQHWKDTYGEEFHSKYPAVAKIIKQRNIKDKRELSRIWQDTYGENFEEQYPALFNKLD
jgi:hypothetical protein|tara:strand:- start:4319 stop:5389 length:1071 start_codon:yes stop_codon:yes gene_type:complete